MLKFNILKSSSDSKRFNLSITICLVYFVAICSSSSDPGGRRGWLRVCGSKKHGGSEEKRHYEVEAHKCPYGAWLTEGVKGNCICLNGVWALSESWCDEDYFIAYGRGHCFRLKKEIRKFSFIGQEENAFEPFNFMTKDSGHVFQKFNDDFQMPYEHSRETNRTILRLRPGKGSSIVLEVKPDMTPDEEIYRRLFSLTYGDDVHDDDDDDEKGGMAEGGLVCVDPKKGSGKGGSGLEDDSLLIHKVSAGIKQIHVVDQCPKRDGDDGVQLDFEDEDLTTLRIEPGQAVHVKSGVIIKSSHHHCPSSCMSKEGLDPSKNSQTALNLSPTIIRHKRQAESDLYPLQLDREMTDEENDEMVNSANLRVVKQELNWLLDAVRPPTIDSKNWKLMQKIKEIFAKVCPKAETPNFLVNAMLRLFRLFYLNSRDFFPNGHMIEEQEQYDRLNVTLETCLADAKEFNFVYGNVKDEGKPCRTAEEEIEDDKGEYEMKTITYCPCIDQLDLVNVTFTLNLTGEPESFNLTGENLTLPEHLRFKLPVEKAAKDKNSQYYDFPTETTWKMVSFVHYYCSKYFRYQGGDHSALMTKMEDFFNEDILYRWRRPGRNSDKVWQFVYSAFNLKKFATSVDACLAGAKFISEYPEWLNRPTLSMAKRRKRSLDSQKLWKGSAYCLEDAWDPVNKLGASSSNKCADFNRYI